MICSNTSAFNTGAVFASEFLRLPETIQNVYVAGVVDGMSFVGYSSRLPDTSKWVDCVRRYPLGTLTEQVVAKLTIDGEALKHPLPWTVAAALGARDCRR